MRRFTLLELASVWAVSAVFTLVMLLVLRVPVEVPPPAVALRPVVVPRTDIPRGVRITIDQLKVQEIPEEQVAGSVLDVTSAEEALGRFALVALEAGVPLLRERLGTEEDRARLIPKRARLFPLVLEPGRALSGAIRPDDHVDVIQVLTDSKTHEKAAITLLQNVTVFASSLAPRALTDGGSQLMAELQLLVLPEESELLALAARQAKLAVSLRHPEDDDVLDHRGRATINTLLSGERWKLLHLHRFPPCILIRGSPDVSAPVAPPGSPAPGTPAPR